MHFVTFVESDRQRVGVLDQRRREVVDLTHASAGLTHDMLALIARGDDGLVAAKAALTGGTARFPLDRVRLLAPIPRPRRNIFCVGKNYRDHLKEVQSLSDGNDAGSDVPIFFTKVTSTVIGPGEPIPAWLDPTHSVDYEGELAVVIGTGGRAISHAEAMNHVFGYTIINDVTSRRLQKTHQQWFLGKSLDGFCPMGPALVTRDAVADVTDLRLRTHVNWELRQDGRTADMIFNIPTLIETLSRTITLETGDIIATGTPAGVGMGFSPPRYLHEGDHVAVTIDPIGTLENPVG
jgi:2-keto-4-pentenoate hydratase/2-oxohepta-3-ene-1,7-dioic acid hydratase in catechol pathway